LHNLFAKLAQFRLATILLVVALLIDVAYETILPQQLKVRHGAADAGVPVVS
jgi:hypothetical protein